MLFKLYSIKDVKIDFSTIFHYVSEEVCIRNIKYLVNDFSQGQSVFNTFVSDKELWYLGTFDTVTGIIVSELMFVSKLSDFMENANV